MRLPLHPPRSRQVSGLKRFCHALLLLALGPVLYALAALTGGVVAAPGEGPDQSAGRVTVYLVRGPIHYDLLIPLTGESRRVFGFLSEAGLPVGAPGAEWLVLGWGSQAFYTRTGSYRDLEPGTVWRAATGDASVMRADLVGPLADGLPLRRLDLSPQAFSRLLAALHDSFAIPSHPLTEKGFTATDVFLPARGRFDLLRTCNVWIGQMLRMAGLRFGIWTPTPYAVTLSLWLYQTAGDPAPAAVQRSRM